MDLNHCKTEFEIELNTNDEHVIVKLLLKFEMAEQCLMRQNWLLYKDGKMGEYVTKRI